MAGEEEILMEEEEMPTSTTTTLLPQDILMEILSRLPAKTLVTIFKLVCKDWRTLIHHPDFIKLHLNRVSINGGGGGEGLIRKSGNGLFQLHPPFNFKDLSSAATKLDFDLSCWRNKSSLVGSCNGLVCLSVNNDERIVLLNPSTMKYKVSPEQLIECPNGFVRTPVLYGFGCYYNSTTTIDEYKIVRIGYCFRPTNDSDYDDDEDDEDDGLQFQIDIYSMSSNSWRSFSKGNCVRCEISGERHGVFLNEAVHWMGCKLGHDNYFWNTIVSFNIRDEEFGLVPLPPCAYIAETYLGDCIMLMNVRGYLGIVLCNDPWEPGSSQKKKNIMDMELEIWVMKDYGIRESWTKEFVIRTSDSDPPREFFGFLNCSLTGDHFLVEGRVLFVSESQSLYHGWPMKGRTRHVLYDITEKKIDGNFIMEVEGSFFFEKNQVDYIETLVSLKSPLHPLIATIEKKEL